MLEPRRLCWLVCVLLAVLSLPKQAFAQSALKLEAVPVLGAGSPSLDGWGQIYLRLENSGASPLSGFVELRVVHSGRGAMRTLSRAPFAIAAKSRVSLLLPSHDLLTRGGGATVRAVDSAGNELSTDELSHVPAASPLLFDLSASSRLVSVLNSQPIPVRPRGGGYPYGGSSVAVTTPQLNVATGEPMLPDLAAGYASATLVLASSRMLSSLSPATLDALFSWLLAGGALAVVLDRPEDLHSAWLEALAGGPVQSCAAARALAGVAEFAVPVDATGKGSMGGGRPRITQQSAKPSSEFAASFFGLNGANLRVTPWGEAASYGLGEVHFLAFNPNTELAASEPWLKLKLLDLMRHAWERANVVALPHGQGTLEDARSSNVRRVLDPNQGTRWTVVVSTLLLLIYAALAGPLNFYLAQRAGRPLRALVYLPVWAAIALGSIVLLGTLGKGLTGRARHLTLIEAGAGMPRAAVTRFRGLYGSRADDLTVRAARGSVLDVLGDPDDVTRDLIVDRDGLRLERLRERPWEVQIVREDGFTNLGEGVSLIASASGELTIKNRAGRDLLGVVVSAPGKGLFYFAELGDGQSAKLAQGRALGPLPSSSPLGTRALSVATFQDEVEKRARGLGPAWEALETLTGSDADWWPDDVPVLLAQIAGGEGRAQDSGLQLDVDRVLVRVVGYGGVP